MKRRLVKQGAATMMISLPSKWVKENKLEKGDEVELAESKDKVIIALSDSVNESQSTEITLTSSQESSIRTILTNIYRQGYDSVKINFKDEEALKIVETTISSQLLGFEVIKKTKDFCLVENITEPSKEHFENIFSKLLMNIDELFNLTYSALTGEKFDDFKSTEEKIKQFDNFCRRIISKEEIPREDLLIAFHQELIHAQRNIYYLLMFMSKNKIKVGKTELDLFSDCKKMFSLLKEAHATKKLEVIEKMHELEGESYKKAYSFMLKPTSNSVVVHHLINASRGFYLASSPLGIFAL